jgi:hypothetical protein
MEFSITFSITTSPLMYETVCLNGRYTVCSESHCALRLRYVDLVVGIEVAIEVLLLCDISLYSVVKQWLKCNTE